MPSASCWRRIAPTAACSSTPSTWPAPAARRPTSRTIRPSLLPYLQIADAPARPPDPAHLREEALHGRLLPGEGDLPLAETLAAVPSVPLSVELRSRAR